MNEKTKKGLKITLYSVLAAGSIFGISRCHNHQTRKLEKEMQMSNQPIFGTVVNESYQTTIEPNPEFDGLIRYSNETIVFGEPKYTLTVETDDGRTIGLSIIDSRSATKESLDAIVDEGTRIMFPRGNMVEQNIGSCCNYDRDETYFTDETQHGTKRAHRVKRITD